jgi:glucan 1,3-beta-glucosidase
MRFAKALPIALAAAPAVVSAAGTLGFALGTKKPDGSWLVLGRVFVFVM